MMATATSFHRLAEVPLFAGLSTVTLDRLASICRVRTYPAGQVLFSEGDPGESLIVLEKGQLRVSRFAASGQEAVLAVMEAPAALGELSLLDGVPRDATVIAQHPVTVRLVPRSVFFELLRREPLFVESLLKTLTALVRFGNSRHADLLALDVPGRLAKWLLAHGVPGPDGLLVELRRSQGELATELATTRSTLNRALQEFAALGYIEVDGDRVTLRQPEGLRASAN